MFKKHLPIDPQHVLQPSRISQTSFRPYKFIKTHQKSIFQIFDRNRPKMLVITPIFSQIQVLILQGTNQVLVLQDTNMFLADEPVMWAQIVPDEL